MIRILPDSSSIVLRATHILVIRIESSVAGEWTPSPDGWLRREAQLTVLLEERLKGDTREDAGTSLPLRVTQYANPSLWTTGVPGVWSEVSIEPGSRLVAFSHSEGDRTAVLLIEPACELLLAESALADVRLALRAEAGEMDLAALVEEAGKIAGSLGHLFVEYLLEAYGDAALRSPETFEPLAQLLEHPGLSLVARATLLSQLTSRLLAGAADPACRERLALAMEGLLGLEAAAPLHDNIRDTFLPNLRLH